MNRLRTLLDDRLIGVLGVVLGVLLFVVTPYAVRTSTALIPGTDIIFIRGDFYPRITAGLLVATGLWLFVSDVLRAMARRPMEPWPGTDTTGNQFAGSTLFLVGYAAYVFMVINVGFAAASFLAFLLLGRAMGGKWLRVLLMASVVTIVMEVVFGRVFGIPLPGRILS